MFENSYQSQHIKEDLAGISFSHLGGSSGDEALFRVLRNASLTRDELAPVDPTAEDLAGEAGFEQRRDIQEMRAELRAAMDSATRTNGSHRIADAVKTLSRLAVQQRREVYFAEVDRRRGLGLSTDDLGEKPAAVQTPATRVGKFLRLGCEQQGKAKAGPQHAFASLLLDLFQNRLSPQSEQTVVAQPSSKISDGTEPPELEQGTKFQCLLCLEGFVTKGSLTRHHGRKHLYESFKKAFLCPECQRLRLECYMVRSATAWSNHVETFHGGNHAPNLPREIKIWHVAEFRARCLICSKHFRAGQGFAKHMTKHKRDGTFDKPFQCSECPENTWVDGLAAWVDHSNRSHGGCSKSGAVILAPEAGASHATPSSAALKRAYDGDPDAASAGRQAKAIKQDLDEGYDGLPPWMPPNHIPIDPALDRIL